MDNLTTHELRLLLQQCDQNLKDKQEELDSQRGMLSSAIDELMKYNKSLTEALENLKSRNVELERLLYQSSHGLRSPITSVLGMIQLLRYEPLSETSVNYIRHIERKSTHMVEIMNSLNSLSKLIGENVSVEEVSVDELVQKNINYFVKLAESNHVQVSYESFVGSHEIQSDPFLISEILKQIIMNGILFRDSEKRGTLLIVSRIIHNQLSLLIEDDGDGIDSTIRSQIFDMFFRGSEKSGGSGLGLYIAKKAADLLHGSISFTSDTRGTSFQIQIPTIFTASSREEAY